MRPARPARPALPALPVTTVRLSAALRWALVGFAFSTLGNQAFEGAFVPIVVSAMLPAWLITASNLVGTLSELFSPVAAAVVARLGAFTALALVELAEGILLLCTFAAVASCGAQAWLLLGVGTLLLLSGQVVDVAAEVFIVDAAQGDDNALVRFSGVFVVMSSVLGVLAGKVVGSALTGVGQQWPFLFAALLSLAAAGTRLFTRRGVHVGTGQAVRPGAHGGAAGAPSTPSEPCPAPPSHRSGWSDLDDARRTRRRRLLLTASAMLGLVPALWLPFTVRLLGLDVGESTITVAYLATGLGAIIGAFLFRWASRRTGMREIARLGGMLSLVGLLLVTGPDLAVVLLGMGIAATGLPLMSASVVTTRQLLTSGPELARLVGRSRLLYACGATAGSLAGLAAQDSQRLLAGLAALGVAAFLAVSGSLTPQAAASSRP